MENLVIDKIKNPYYDKDKSTKPDDCRLQEDIECFLQGKKPEINTPGPAQDDRNDKNQGIKKWNFEGKGLDDLILHNNSGN